MLWLLLQPVGHIYILCMYNKKVTSTNSSTLAASRALWGTHWHSFLGMEWVCACCTHCLLNCSGEPLCNARALPR